MNSEGDEFLEMEEEKEEGGEQSKEIITPELNRKRGPEKEPNEKDHEVKGGRNLTHGMTWRTL